MIMVIFVNQTPSVLISRSYGVERRVTAKLDIVTAGKVFPLKIKAKMWLYIPIRLENGGKIWSGSCKINKHETSPQCFKSLKYMGNLS